MKLTNIVSIDVKKMYLKISDQYFKNWLFYRLIFNGLWYQLFLTPYWHQCVCVCVFWGGWFEKPPPPKISETNGRMTMKFLPGVKYHREAKNPKTILTLFIA